MSRPLVVLLAGGLAVLTASAGQAHEIKALASQLAVAKPGDRATIYLSWGHRVPVDDLIDAGSIERYDLLSPAGKVLPLKKADLSLQANSVDLPEAGVYQVLVARKPSISTYVIDDEGNRILKRGPKSAVKEGKIDSASRSVQCARAIIVVGPPGKEPVKAAGLPVEIVPLDGPAAWIGNATLRFQVLLEGKPLPGADLTARYIGFKPDDAWCYATTTERDGIATVRPDRAGTWILKVTSKRPTTGAAREQYDYESFTTTLSLEIQP